MSDASKTVRAFINNYHQSLCSRDIPLDDVDEVLPLLPALVKELEEAKEDLAVAKSQVENADATLEQMRLVDKRNLAAARERIATLENFIRWVWVECENHDGQRIRDAAYKHIQE